MNTWWNRSICFRPTTAVLVCVIVSAVAVVVAAGLALLGI